MTRTKQFSNGNFIIPVRVDIDGADFDAHTEEEIGADDPRYADYLRFVEGHDPGQVPDDVRREIESLRTA